MPQKEDKAQESRDKLGYLGNSENTKVTPEQYEGKCCGHGCCGNEKIGITTEETVVMLIEEIPGYLANITEQFYPVAALKDLLTPQEGERLTIKEGFVSGPGYGTFTGYGIPWKIEALGFNFDNFTHETTLTLKLPGRTLRVTNTNIVDTNSAGSTLTIPTLLNHREGMSGDDVMVVENLINNGGLPPYAVKELEEIVFENSTGISCHEWKKPVLEIIRERLEISQENFDLLMRKLENAAGDLKKLREKTNSYRKGLEKAVQGLRDSKSFTKSPQLKELRHELEEIIYGRENLRKWAYEFYNN